MSRKRTKMESVGSQLPATLLNSVGWIDLQVPFDQMNPLNTLNMGQCFNWKKLDQISADKAQLHYWIGVLDETPIIIKQTSTATFAANLSQQLDRPGKRAKVTPNTNDGLGSESDKLQQRLCDYFQLQYSLPDLYNHWSERCPRMKIVTSCIQGVRVVRQDPWECLISFICSSNNNISRITLMLDRLRKKYGRYLCTIQVDSNSTDVEASVFINYNYVKEVRKQNSINEKEGESEISSIDLYTFPTAQALVQSATEADLRSLGMGYRAKFILETAKLVVAKPPNYFEDLRHYGCYQASDPSLTLSSDEKRLFVQNALLEFPGVGQKVADCVALFSLDQGDTVPIDTHVWSIAMRDYAPTVLSPDEYEQLISRKSLTPTVYEQVGGIFRKLFQQKPGWAHSVLFAAELPGYRILLPSQLQKQMKEYDDQQRLQRKEIKEQKAFLKASKKGKNNLEDNIEV